MNFYKIALKNTRAHFLKRKKENEENFKIRKEKVHNASPEIAEIDRNILLNISAFTRSALKDGKVSAEKARKKDNELKEKRREILRNMNLPENFLDSPYNCRKCSDMGFIGTTMCDCFKEELQNEEIRLRKSAAKAMEASFSSFSLGYYRKDEFVSNNITEYDYMSFVKTRAENFCKDYDNKPKGLIFAGNTGTGKTFLSKCIYNTLTEQGEDVFFDYAQNIFDKTEREKYTNIGYSYTEKIMTCPLLIIDDLGSEMVSPFSTAMLYNILNTREENGLTNIITTNLEPDGLMKKYENRIVSRLLGNQELVLFKGRDIRQLKNL